MIDQESESTNVAHAIFSPKSPPLPVGFFVFLANWPQANLDSGPPVSSPQPQGCSAGAKPAEEAGESMRGGQSVKEGSEPAAGAKPAEEAGDFSPQPQGASPRFLLLSCRAPVRALDGDETTSDARQLIATADWWNGAASDGEPEGSIWRVLRTVARLRRPGERGLGFGLETGGTKVGGASGDGSA